MEASRTRIRAPEKIFTGSVKMACTLSVSLLSIVALLGGIQPAVFGWLLQI